jgi:hypothetical protein
MSHVFLGTSAKGGNPMLISIPKDSNMTVKELIQMMGNRGENSELETEGDNPITLVFSGETINVGTVGLEVSIIGIIELVLISGVATGG